MTTHWYGVWAYGGGDPQVIRPTGAQDGSLLPPPPLYQFWLKLSNIDGLAKPRAAHSPMVDRSRTPPIYRRRRDQLLAALFDWTPPAADRQPQPRSPSPPSSSKEPRAQSLPIHVGASSKKESRIQSLPIFEGAQSPEPSPSPPSSSATSVKDMIRVRSPAILVVDTAAKAMMRTDDEPLLEDSTDGVNAPNVIEEAFLQMAAAAPPMEEPAAEAALVGAAMGLHEAHPADHPPADEATVADRPPADDEVDRGDVGDVPPSEAPGSIQDSLAAALLAQDPLAPGLPAESLDSQCTLIERQMELDRIQAEADAEVRRAVELERLQAEADARRLDAMERARDDEYDKAMRQNVPIQWGCIMDDMILATADDRLSIAIGAIDGVGSTGQAFYVGATRSPIHRWLGGETSRGYMEGHCESWSAMKLIGITPPGEGGPMERALIQRAKKTYPCQCQNRADDNRGMSPQYHCFLYAVFGAA